MQQNVNIKFQKLIKNLDLFEHIEQFLSFFARDNSLYIEGDQELHFRYIKELDKLEFNAPPKIMDLGNIKLHLKKHGVLHFNEIFEIVKLIRYLRYFKNKNLNGILKEWFDKIVIEPKFLEVESYFTKDGNFDEQKDLEVSRLSLKIAELKNNISDTLKKLIYSQKISPYLIDTQIHYINNEEAILVRGGFNHVLKGSIVSRSSGGGFYVIPESIIKLKDQIKEIQDQKEIIFYNYAKEFSSKFSDILPFISFVDKEFSRFDSYQARVFFAKSKDLQIIKAQKNRDIILHEFVHPALSHAKPINVEFRKNVLMITGVNAGGKTMLLKSLLSSVFMAKYMIPQRVNEHRSSIGSFKNIFAIIDDPQNVKNDISTFAGRMQEFSKIFTLSDALIGVDEIELGTDSDEAAALFKVILDELVRKNQKIIITTHHKRLASLMAERDDVELLAAIYDEINRVPTYEFMSGIIGKSYAFETASRYGIASFIVQKAKEVYGKESEQLNILIEKGSQLQRELKAKHKLLDEKLDEVEKKSIHIREQKLADAKELDTLKAKLYAEYQKAIEEAKSAAKLNDTKEIHKALNRANALLPKEKKREVELEKIDVGDSVKYMEKKGRVVSLKDRFEAIVEVEGMRLRVKTKDLKKYIDTSVKKPKIDLNLQVEKKAGLKCDLHGLRAEEATQVLDKFLSDALLNGWDEVIIYHGIGTGKLAYAIKEFLKLHPKVKGFIDAPAHMGGYGAKIVSL